MQLKQRELMIYNASSHKKCGKGREEDCIHYYPSIYPNEGLSST
jgi:hypothetical protein